MSKPPRKPRSAADRLARCKERIDTAASALLGELKVASKQARLTQLRSGEISPSFDTYWHGMANAFEHALRELKVTLFEIEHAKRMGEVLGIEQFQAEQKVKAQ
jgi:hypothetical protein